MRSEQNNVEMHQKNTQIGSGIMKMWAFRGSGLTFFGPPCRAHCQ